MPHPIVDFSKKSNATLKCQKDQNLLALLRSGHLKVLTWYQNWIMPDEYDATCPLLDAPFQTLEYWLIDCSGTEATRIRHFEYLNVGLGSLNTRPQELVVLARSTLKKVKPKMETPASALLA